jgi:hypothetical protein
MPRGNVILFLYGALPQGGEHWVREIHIQKSFIYVLTMSRKRGRLKRGWGEYTPVGRPPSSISGSDNLNNHRKQSRSPSLSTAVAYQHDKDHTSSSWGCKIEWFDRRGHSLGYAPKSFPGWNSLESPPPSFPCGHSSRTHGALSLGHPITHPSEVPSSNKPSTSKEEDSQHIFEALSTLQHLIFELRSKVFNVKFRHECLEHCISLMMDLSTN